VGLLPFAEKPARPFALMTVISIPCEPEGSRSFSRSLVSLCGTGQLRRALAPFIFLCALAGCASTPKLGGDSGLRVVQTSELPAPDRTEFITSSRPYYVGPYDKLVVDVFGMPELSKREVQVDAGGMISFPLAGSVEVSGRTTAEIERILAERLHANYLRSPQVSVLLKENVSKLLTIEGQVNRPGLYPVVGELSLLQVMALSGGTTEFSKLDDVVIFRTVKGEKLAALYDLKAIRHGQYPDPEVFANDVVVVGDNTARRFFKDLLQVVPLLTGPLVVAISQATR
jgi:polysaccharide export outer membrane protein